MRYFATERDEGRYVKIPATWTRRRSALFQEITTQVSKPFRRNECVPSNVTRTIIIKNIEVHQIITKQTNQKTIFRTNIL